MSRTILEPKPPRRRLMIRAVCELYGGVCSKTIDRWVSLGILPKPEKMNGGPRSWDEAALDEVDRRRAAAQWRSQTR